MIEVEITHVKAWAIPNKMFSVHPLVVFIPIFISPRNVLIVADYEHAILKMQDMCMLVACCLAQEH